jgi:hypothetical protein
VPTLYPTVVPSIQPTFFSNMPTINNSNSSTI